jgi:hypothetical protein
MHSKDVRRMALIATLGLSFGIAQAAAQNRVATDNIDQWDRTQIVAALRSVLANEGCRTDAEKTYKGTGIWEIKCSLGEEKLTVQVASETFSSSDTQGKTLQKSFTSVWIKTTGGNKIWSKIIDQEMLETLRESDKAVPQH